MSVHWMAAKMTDGKREYAVRRVSWAAHAANMRLIGTAAGFLRPIKDKDDKAIALHRAVLKTNSRGY